VSLHFGQNQQNKNEERSQVQTNKHHNGRHDTIHIQQGDTIHYGVLSEKKIRKENHHHPLLWWVVQKKKVKKNNQTN